MREQLSDSAFGRIVSELLKLTRNGMSSQIGAVASGARCSVESVGKVLDTLGHRPNDRLRIQTKDRVALAFESGRRGVVADAVKFLDWPEFEVFAETCLGEAGYDSSMNIRVKDDRRTWQIDLVGIKSRLALCIDCKHWNTPSYPSKYAKAAERQTIATRVFLENSRANGSHIDFGLPVLLTLFEPRMKVQKAAVLLSVNQLPDFLANVTIYTADLPFIEAN